MLYEVLPPSGAFAVNYGTNRVRFPAPVPSGSAIRGRFRVVSIEDDGRAEIARRIEATVECDGVEKPVCVAELVVSDSVLTRSSSLPSDMSATLPPPDGPPPDPFRRCLAVAAVAGRRLRGHRGRALAFNDDSCDERRSHVVPADGARRCLVQPHPAGDRGTGTARRTSFGPCSSGALPPGLSHSPRAARSAARRRSRGRTCSGSSCRQPRADGNPCCPGVANPFWCKTRGTVRAARFTITIDPGSDRHERHSAARQRRRAVLHDARGSARHEPQSSDGPPPGPFTWSVVGARSRRA